MEANNIYLGDCYELIKQIPDKSVDLVYTDIPYEFVGGGSGGAFGEGNKSYNSAIKLSKTSKKGSMANSGIDYSIMDELVRVLKYIYIYIWCSKAQIPPILDYFTKLGCNYDLLVWCKTNPVPKTNNNYLPDIEYCLMFREKACKLNDGYNLKSKWYISPLNKQDKDIFLHPTIKPLELVKRHILHSTQENDLVLDCFAGSGTTLKACKDLNRRYIGFEINEEYYKIAKDRLNNIDAKGQYHLFE